MNLVCISDTHGLHRKIKLPEGDILIHAGDFTRNGELSTIHDFNLWLGEQKENFKYILVIAGNHDRSFESNPEIVEPLLTNAIYLKDSGVVIDDVSFWGSPWQPWFCNWAFNLQRGQPLKEKWDLIPDDTDVLITHGPPYGILDVLDDIGSEPGKNIGCEDLMDRVRKINPKVHVFGHIHEGYGMHAGHRTNFINASSCTSSYKPTNTPIVIYVSNV